MRGKSIPRDVIEKSRQIEPPFGGDFGKIVYARTYRKALPDGSPETWQDTILRVMDMLADIAHQRLPRHATEWVLRKLPEMYLDAVKMKWTPPGRGLQMAGSPMIFERERPEVLNNCAFISTQDISSLGGSIFEWTVIALSLGVGVGFDTRGSGKVRVKHPDTMNRYTFVVPDSREGWAEAVRRLVDSYLYGLEKPKFDYSKIRPFGAPVRGMGGTASGPEPLKLMLERIDGFLSRRIGESIRSVDIVDIFNAIGACVSAGNIRRSSQIALGMPHDLEFPHLKNYEKFPYRREFGWASNNSILVDGQWDLSRFLDLIMQNGEPGFVFLDMIQHVGRMGEHRPDNAIGINPCGEQPLAHGEMCTLVEIHAGHCTPEDIKRVAQHAYIYAKLVTLLSDMVQSPITREPMMENRRMGISITGIAQFVHRYGWSAMYDTADETYRMLREMDERVSKAWGVNQSIRLTSIKPSGTVSSVTGNTHGVHGPFAPFYIRRMRINRDHPLVEQLKQAGYKVEKDAYADNTLVVEFPVASGAGKRWNAKETLFAAKTMQKFWSDNSVSVTVPIREGDVDYVEEELAYRLPGLKSVSFMPDRDDAYVQMPYEEITEKQYREAISRIKPLNLGETERDMEERYCDGEACEIVR